MTNNYQMLNLNMKPMTFDMCIKCVELLLSNTLSRFVHIQRVVGDITSQGGVDVVFEIVEWVEVL